MKRQVIRIARVLAAGVIAVVVVGGQGFTTSAHDDIGSSDPASGSKIDEPISEVTLVFLSEIADDIDLALLDPDENLVGSVTTKLSPTVAKVEFELLDRKGTYIVRYIATTVSDGHLTTGAISFKYGSTGSGMSLAVWALFGIVSAGILAVGVHYSVRNHRQLVADASGVE